MSGFSLKEIKSQNTRPQQLITTLIQVTGYQLEGDPKTHRILGRNLEDRDENGVPKDVKVAIEPYSERQGTRAGNRTIPKPKEFAEWVNTKTDIGGTILISRAVERNGELVADYAQRISQNSDMVRKGGNGVDYKIGCQPGWISVWPVYDKTTGELRVTGGGSKPEYHSATAGFYPDNGIQTDFQGGPGAGQTIREAFHSAIDALPDARMQPLLMLFQENEESHQSFFVPNRVKDPHTNEYRWLTKEEMKASVDQIESIKQYMELLSSEAATGVKFRTRNGFTLNMMGSRNVNEAATEALRGQGIDRTVYDKSDIERKAPETYQQFRLPAHMQSSDRKRDVQKKSVFVHAYVSYEIPTVDNQRPSLQKIAKTVDKNFDQRNSLNGGMTVLRNPHWETDDQGFFITPDNLTAAIPAASQNTQQANHQASMAAQAPIPQTQNQQAYHAPATAAAAVVTPKTEPQPEPMPEPPVPDDSEIDQYFGEMDFDMDDFESELDQGPTGPGL